MPGFGPASAPVANCTVLGFLEASSSHKFDYNGSNTLNPNRGRTFETQVTHPVMIGPSRIRQRSSYFGQRIARARTELFRSRRGIGLGLRTVVDLVVM